LFCAPNDLADQVTDDEMGGACGTYKEEQKCIQGFGCKTLKENQLEDLGVNGSTILKRT
jgi:hypothetical protein